MSQTTHRNLRSKAVIAALFILTLTAASALAIGGPGTSVAQGHWVLSDDQSCPGEQVCTEWELASGERKDIYCCMDPSMVGSSDPNACGTEEGQFRQ